MQLGSFHCHKPIILAPMAGVSDAPFREVCLANGADLAVHEMVASRSDLRTSTKSTQRLKSLAREAFKWVQIVGTDPQMIASSAQHNVALGADAIDINMGCPAKKVCKKAAGSALLADPKLVEDILQSTVAAVDKPVTVKIRTGTDPDNRNAVLIARIAENAGVQCITIHGRTRADRFKGVAEYQTIKQVKQAVSIPVIANGDIADAAKAFDVLEYTQADGLMLGRAAYGNPWLFNELKAALAGQNYHSPSPDQITATILRHISRIHQHYGEYSGVRIARKHIGWYLERLQLVQHKKLLLSLETADEQIQRLSLLLSEFALQEAV